MRPMRSHKPFAPPGFTLLEILIALAIFTIVATITATALKQSLLTQTHLSQQAQQLRSLQLALMRIQQDLTQVTNRPVRGDDMHTFPAWIGQPTYIEFTRTGGGSPVHASKQSELNRVGYLCQHDQLIRKSYPRLDPVTREIFKQDVILSRIKTCRFSFLNHAKQNLPVWRGGNLTPLPIAVHLTLSLEPWGSLESVFILPEGYDVA